MEKWKITVDRKQQVHVKPQSDGNFTSLDEATTLAKTLAQENKTLLFIHDDIEATFSDYTSFLSLGEMKLKLHRDLKTAEAELTVAKASMNKWKNAYRLAEKDEKQVKKTRYLDAKQRVFKEKINVKRAKKKYDEILQK